ncbi:YwiB family protein [Clostridium felsineum]|uniref:Beta-barrel protein YwiB n=1 Tax=Clostridium felsineum TaxID=36839 RepID=A0A1S8KX14_9CLOT|nr:DUF1934 family protein [Clostridium felsineum]URZ03721.1 putative beta-barrel protein YwiB [Clostridium felsineum]URZ07973.1 putative beta-barrel protein YwiB [Clostridium felsineum]URZ13004.1 putative beta-barrel protein YwiB [Clostridium felsineum]
MGRKAIISISSKQGKDEPISVVTPGDFYKKNNCYYATYKETEISGMEGTTTTLKIKDDKCSILRQGSTSTKMEFEKDKDNYSIYSTPYGTMELKISTKNIDINVNDDGGDVNIRYDLSIVNQLSQSTIIDINIKTLK